LTQDTKLRETQKTPPVLWFWNYAVPQKPAVGGGSLAQQVKPNAKKKTSTWAFFLAQARAVIGAFRYGWNLF
jgi:hypothetical protein